MTDPLALALAALHQRRRLRAVAEELIGAIDDGADGDALAVRAQHFADVLGSLLLVEREQRGEREESWGLSPDY